MARNTAQGMARDTTRQAWAWGGTVLAGTLMLIIGAYQIFLGITAIVRGNFVVTTPNTGYYVINRTGWGWTQLGIGIVVALAGLFLFTGSRIAKAVGIAVVALSALGNFFLIPYYPVWAILLIALDVFVIWAIANARTDQGAMARADEQAMAGYGTGAGYGSEYGTAQAGDRWPAENAPGGRHWAPENVKEGQPQQMPGETAQQAQERASAAGRTMPPGGNPPPQP